MRQRWCFPAAAVIFMMGLSVTAQAQNTFLYMNSQPGDYIGQGQQYLLQQPADGSFLALRNFDNGVSVDFSGVLPGNWWSLDFAAPNSVDLVPGMYEGATRFPFQSPTGPGLSISGQGRGCNTLTGRFVVLEAVYGVAGNVVSFAADFEQHCEGGTPALFGSMRFNSSVPTGPRLSVSSQSVAEQDAGSTAVIVRASLSGPATAPVTVQYTTIDGTATSGSDYVAASGSLTIPTGATVAQAVVQVLGDTADEPDETFRVVLSNPVNAAIAFGEGVITILDDDPEKTLIYFDSDPGDYIGQGVIRRFTFSDGTFSASIQGSNAVRVGFMGEESWYLTFAAPGALPPTPGTYEGATRWPFQAPGVPGLDVSGDGRGCNMLTGRFVVLEAVYGPGGVVERFAADFEQHCEGLVPALLGSVRYRSLIPASSLSIRATTVPEAQGALNLHVTLSFPAAADVTVPFTTTPGTATAGVDYAPTSGVLTIPAGATGGDIQVPIVSDSEEELDETFRVDLGAAVGATVLRGQALVTILDDDPRFPVELAHGSVQVGSLRFPNLDGDFYAFTQPPYTSWEAVVDATSGDIGLSQGPRVRLITLGLPTQDSSPVGTGPSRTLRVSNVTPNTISDKRIQVQSDSCTLTCNADDTYRIRFYETTYTISRFNVGPGRLSVLILQNPTNHFVNVTPVFWNAAGTMISAQDLFLAPKSSALVNLDTVAGLPNQAGSITIPNTAPYGALAGKLVTLETDSGFSFDVPMQPRPR